MIMGVEPINKNIEHYLVLKNTCTKQFSIQTEYSIILPKILLSIEWGKDAKHLVEALPHYTDKLSKEGFMSVMQILGYNIKSVEISLQDVKQNILPCLFVNSKDEALVILESNSDTFKILDSNSETPKIIKKEEVKGTIYKFSSRDKKQHKVGNTNWILEELSINKSTIGYLIFISFVLNFLYLATPFVIMHVFNTVIPNQSTDILLQLGIVLALVYLIITFLHFSRNTVLEYISYKFDKIIPTKIFAHMLKLPAAKTQNLSFSLDIINLNGLDKLKKNLNNLLGNLVLDAPFIVLAIIFIGFISKSVLISLFVMFGMFTCMSILLYSSSATNAKEHIKATTKTRNFLIETISKFKTIKTSKLEESWLNRFKKISSDLTLNNYFVSAHNSVIQSLSEIFIVGTGIIVLWIGAISIINNSMTLGTVIALIVLVWRVIYPLKLAFTSLFNLIQTKAKLNQFFTLMSLNQTNDGATNINQLLAENASIKIDFKDVKFNYQSTHKTPVLSKLNFSINQNEFTLISGRNGVGKSTILKLIQGYYKPTSGNIIINGIDINTIDNQVIHDLISFCPEESQVFYGTVEQNLRFGNQLASREQVIEACKMAGILEDINTLPEKFQTRINHRVKSLLSNNLLKGISLARSYLRASPILILDEPSISLNAKGKIALNRAIEKLRKNTTIIIASHDQEYFNYVDKLIILDSGTLSFCGPISDNNVEEIKISEN